MNRIKLLKLISLLKRIYQIIKKYKLNSYSPIRFVYHRIEPFLLSLRLTRIGKNIMYLGKRDVLGLHIHSFWEERETKILKTILKRGDVAIDIGANIGYYTLIFAELVGEEGIVFAFEPDKDNFLILSKNIKINKYNNIVLERKAISDTLGLIRFYLGDNSGGHKIFKVNNDEKFITVQSTTLDDYFKGFHKSIKLIKIDIEGAEISAISKAKCLIERNDNLFLLTEFFPDLIKKFGYHPGNYLDLLTSMGFRLFPIYDNNHNEYINILCVKRRD